MTIRVVGSEFVLSVPENRMHGLRNSLLLPLVAKGINYGKYKQKERRTAET